MAKKLKVSTQAYMLYEKGRRNIPSTVLIQLQNLGFSADWILSGTGSVILNKQSESMESIEFSELKINNFNNNQADKHLTLKKKKILEEKVNQLKEEVKDMSIEQQINILNGILLILHSSKV